MLYRIGGTCSRGGAGPLVCWASVDQATNARTAERMISERLVPSFSASMRTGTTRAAPSPIGRRPRFFSTSTMYPRSVSSAHSWIISSVTGTPLMVST